MERGIGAITIKWRAARQDKQAVVIRVLLGALGLAILYVLGEDPLFLILVGVVLLGTLYQLLAGHVNRMSIRTSDSEWVFRRGSPLSLDPDFGWIRLVKTLNPTLFDQVTSSAVGEEKGEHQGSGGRAGSLAGLLPTFLLDPASWYRHKTGSPRTTHELWMKTQRGRHLKVLSRLNGEQAEYLAQVLQPLLAREESAPGRSEASPKGLWWLRDEKKHRPAAAAEVGRTTAAPQILAASEGASASTTEQAGAGASPLVCAACSASNPVDSAFCGECGASLGAQAACGGAGIDGRLTGVGDGWAIGRWAGLVRSGPGTMRRFVSFWQFRVWIWQFLCD